MFTPTAWARIAAILATALWVAGLTGCSSLSPAPFQQFSSSVTELSEGTDTALTAIDEANRSRFIRETAMAVVNDEADTTIPNLIIKPGTPMPFAWTLAQDFLFMESPRFHAAVNSLNGSLVSYAQLLEQVIGEASISPEEFEDRANRLNDNLREAGTALGAEDDPARFAFFSTLATQMFQSYLQKHSRQELREALQNNQEGIQTVADHMVRALRMAAQQIWADYNSRSGNLALAIADVGAADAYLVRNDLADLVEVNDDLILSLRGLDSLATAYRMLPGAHANLATALDDKQPNLAAIRELHDRALYLKDLYRELAAE